ncbi:MAG: CinA family protein [Alphaproteobacteria bacterium]|nr:CinA family protein [Alphaproteobacteria bacterium]
MTFPADLLAEAESLLTLARAQNVLIATAESCTGGLISALITEIPGSSDVFERGFVTYANQAKIDLLAIGQPLLDEFGAVSKEVAIAMAQGAVMHSGAHMSVAVTGIAGPGGGVLGKPVGTVHIASHYIGQDTRHEQFHFVGERSSIRLGATTAALKMLKVWFD